MARLIKRYENRKLYDTVASTYVSQADVADLIRQGETVEVIDNATGNDLTAQILTQIILEEGKRGQSAISTEALHDLVRRSGEMIDSSIEQIRHGMDDLVHTSWGRVNQMIQGAKSNDLQHLRGQLARLDELLSRMLGGISPDAADPVEETTPDAPDAETP